MDITKLYQAAILKKSNDDTFFEKRPTAQHTLDAYNPMCGDKFKLFLDVENGIIAKATFHGYGCAISKASTAVLTEKIQNQTCKDALILINTYFEVLKVENTVEERNPDSFGKEPFIAEKSTEIDADLQAFDVMQQFPERMTCATLSWQAALDFFNSEKE
jgi:nitrogen fixation protein NifU and related proteins